MCLEGDGSTRVQCGNQCPPVPPSTSQYPPVPRSAPHYLPVDRGVLSQQRSVVQGAALQPHSLKVSGSIPGMSALCSPCGGSVLTVLPVWRFSVLPVWRFSALCAPRVEVLCSLCSPCGGSLCSPCGGSLLSLLPVWRFSAPRVEVLCTPRVELCVFSP